MAIITTMVMTIFCVVTGPFMFSRRDRAKGDSVSISVPAKKNVIHISLKKYKANRFYTYTSMI